MSFAESKAVEAKNRLRDVGIKDAWVEALLATFSTGTANGADAEDRVTKDGLEAAKGQISAKIEGVLTLIAKIEGELREGSTAVRGALEALEARLDKKIDVPVAKLAMEIEALDKKIEEAAARLAVEIEALDKKIEGTEARLAVEIEAVRREIETAVARLEDKIEAVRGEIEVLRARLDKVEEAMARLALQNESLSTQIADGHARLLRWMVATMIAVGGLIVAAMRL